MSAFPKHESIVVRVGEDEHLDFDYARSMGWVCVVLDGWCSSTTSGPHLIGHEVSLFRVLSAPGEPYRTERHWLDGFVFMNREDATRAGYNAGVLGLYFYAGVSA